MNVSSSGPYNKANIFLGSIEYEMNSLLGASHLVDYISVHIRFDLERYLPNIKKKFMLPLTIELSDHKEKVFHNAPPSPDLEFWYPGV